MANEWAHLGGHGNVRGDRVAMHVKVPRDLKAAIDAAAAESGMPIADYVSLVLAKRLGLPSPEYIVLPDSATVDQLDLGLPDRRETRLSA